MPDMPGPDDAFAAALYRLLAADGGNLVFPRPPASEPRCGWRCAARTQTAAEITMTADHPFLFAITDTSTGLLLFLGRVTRPGGQ